MNLNKLFDTQKVLDTRIGKEHPKVDGEDRLAKKILALQVELGELANEWRGFKFWSNDQEPRNKDIKCHACKGSGVFSLPDDPFEPCLLCDSTGIQDKNPMLIEYVDCLHFILSIGLEDAKRYGETYPIYYKFESIEAIKYESIIEQFNYSFSQISYFMDCACQCEMGTETEVDEQYETIFRIFLGLGEMLGFTREQIEQAYYEKNEVNHERQNTGY